MTLLKRVISGGQTGVDIAALRTAKEFGIPTGGTMPKGWLTLDGAKPEYERIKARKAAASAWVQDPLTKPRCAVCRWTLGSYGCTADQCRKPAAASA